MSVTVTFTLWGESDMVGWHFCEVMVCSVEGLRYRDVLDDAAKGSNEASGGAPQIGSSKKRSP